MHCHFRTFYILCLVFWSRIIELHCTNTFCSSMLVLNGTFEPISMVFVPKSKCWIVLYNINTLVINVKPFLWYLNQRQNVESFCIILINWCSIWIHFYGICTKSETLNHFALYKYFGVFNFNSFPRNSYTCNT